MSTASAERPGQQQDRTTGAGSAQPDGSGKSQLKKLLQGNTLVPLLIAAAAGIAIVGALLMWANTQSYEVLFNNLGEADGGRIINELDSRGVPYEFGAGGRAILVPAEQVHMLRLQLAEQGLPEGGSVGFELMDGQAFGISQFAEQVNYQRSLEGELSRSIGSMGPVSEARVHLSMAKPSVFIRDREPAKASVVLTLTGGRTMGQSQVNAIMHLVSSSIPDLSPDNVTVVDQAGRLLSQHSDGDIMDGQQLRYAREVERRYQERIDNILKPLFGEDNFSVQVAAELDFSLREETVERYGPNQDPEFAAVRSAQVSGTVNGADALARGIPGALSNTPPDWAASEINQDAEDAAGGDGAQQGQPADSDSLQYDNLVNYEVDRNITHIQHEKGQIERLSVAAVVNYRDGFDEEGNPIQVALSEEEMTQVTRLVQQAMGFSELRGDQLEVVNSPFSTESEEVTEEVDWWATPLAEEVILRLSHYLPAALAALFFYLLIVRPLLRRHLATPVVSENIVARQAAPGGADAPEAKDDKDNGDAGQEEPAPRHKRKRQASNYEQDLKEVRELAREDPRLVSMVVRSWMTKNG